MGLFGKNKNKTTSDATATQNGAAVTEQVSVTAPAPAKKKKKKDTMASVLSESVVETVLEQFAENTVFTFDKDGETVHVGMLLDTADIGGLTKKSSKDEAKGSMIEQMNSGLIKTFITPSLMEDEKIVIVPDAMTIHAMDEYGLLNQAPYHACYVHTDGGVELTDIAITYDDVEKVLNDSMDLYDLLGIEYEDEQPVEVDDAEELDDEAEMVESNDDTTGFVNDDDEPELTDDEFDESMYANSMPTDEIAGYENEFIEDDSTAVLENDYESDEYSENLSEYDDDEIPDELVTQAIIRKFYSDDLGLEVTTEPFDAQFLHQNTFIPFDTDRGDGWLNQYLNQMSKDANAAMKRLHQDNLFKMREFYYQLISGHCDEIQKQLDTANPETQFGRLFESLKKQKMAAEDNIDRAVSDKKAEMEQEWEKRLNQVADDAARAAKQQYRERFGRQHDEEMYHIQPNIKDEIEHGYQDSIRRMNDDRRIEASKRLDYGINESLKTVTEMYMKCLDEENVRYKEFADSLQAFIDENRKDEIARTKALQEELDRVNKVDKLQEEHAIRIQNLTADFDAKHVSLQADIDKMERNNEQKLKECESDWQTKLADAQVREEQLQKRVDELLQKYTDLDAKKNAEFESRILELTNEKVSLEDRCLHIEKVHKRSNVISIFLVVVIAIATLCIGFIAGEFINIHYDTEITSQQIREQIEQQYEEELNDMRLDSISSDTVEE